MYRRAASQTEREAALYLAEILTKGEELGGVLARRLTGEQRQRLEHAVREMDAVLQSALDSMPEGTRESIKRTARNVVIRITPRSVGALGSGYLAVSEEDMGVLAMAAMRGDCACTMCMRSGDAVRTCKLREVLRRHFEVRDSRYGMCGYAGIPLYMDKEDMGK